MLSNRERKLFIFLNLIAVIFSLSFVFKVILYLVFLLTVFSVAQLLFKKKKKVSNLPGSRIADNQVCLKCI